MGAQAAQLAGYRGHASRVAELPPATGACHAIEQQRVYIISYPKVQILIQKHNINYAEGLLIIERSLPADATRG